MVAELVPGGNAELSGLVQVGDELVACGVGEQLFDTTTDDIDTVFAKLSMEKHVPTMALRLVRAAPVGPGARGGFPLSLFLLYCQPS